MKKIDLDKIEVNKSAGLSTYEAIIEIAKKVNELIDKITSDIHPNL